MLLADGRNTEDSIDKENNPTPKKTIPRIKAKLAGTSLEDLGSGIKPKAEIKKSQAGLRSICGAEQHSLHAMI